jgi:hypothetical protein
MGYPGAALNQLLLIAAEDVGLADPSLIEYEGQCLYKFEDVIKANKIKKRDAVNYPNLCEIVDRAAIAGAISYKSRLLPMFSFATLYQIYNNEDFGHDLYYYLERFIEALDHKDEGQALYYAYVVSIFLESKDRLMTVIYNQSHRRNQALIQIWIDEYRRKNELLMLAGSVVLLCRDLSFRHGEYKNAINQFLSVPIQKANIPDRAYDMHTGLGKRKGRGFDHFFNEGASVKNERFPNDWESNGRNAYYQAGQLGLGKSKKIIETVKETQRGQIYNPIAI